MNYPRRTQVICGGSALASILASEHQTLAEEMNANGTPRRQSWYAKFCEWGWFDKGEPND